MSVEETLARVVESIGGATREGQVTLANAVADALENDGHLLAQAGTGTGKSFGYLVPAALWTVKTGLKVVVSTATKALQRQISTSDAPHVIDAVAAETGAHVKIKVHKGWNNYACLRKVSGGYPEDDALLSRAEGEMGATAMGEEVVRAREWALTTETGDRDDLVPGVSDRVWAQISVKKPECLGTSCIMRASCFPVIAREEAAEADIIVTNHTMLGVQANGTPILPASDAFIIDEAHELVDSVTTQLTAELSKWEMLRIARSLRRAKLSDCDLDDSAKEIEEALAEIEEGRLRAIPEALSDAIGRALGRLQEASEEVATLSGKDDESAATKLVLKNAVTDAMEVCHVFLGDGVRNGDNVPWVSEQRNGGRVLYCAPLDVSARLADQIFLERPAILTSATLQIGGSFDLIAAKVGMAYPSQGEWTGLDVGSPFDPAKQGILYVASHLAAMGRGQYGDAALDEIVDLINASGGGALCLFTARSAAERAAEYVRDRVDVPVLCQGEDQISTLISNFADDDAACLFGTRSLWQGVDVPGRTCRLVIIDRIPFPRPDDPITAARSEAANRSGGNGFRSVSLAQAALGLAQGSGRLLRRMDDRGVVAILDSRLGTASYANFLLASMQRFWPTTSKDVVLSALRRLNDE